MTDEEVLILMGRFVTWKDEGRYMGDYVHSNMFPFLYRLVGTREYLSYAICTHREILEEVAPGLLGKLAGPHGYTVLRALIAVYEERKSNSKKEVTDYAGLQKP